MKKIFFLILLILKCSFVFAADIYVDDAATGPLYDGSQGDPFKIIQDGMDAATSGDVVHVAPGTYTGAGNVNLAFGGAPNDYTVLCDNPLTCIIDGESADVRGIFSFAELTTSSTVFEGFIIQNCDKSGPGGGFGLAYSSPTINRCWVRYCSNTSGVGGGGIWVNNSTSVFNAVIVSQNSATPTGGGIRVEVTGITLRNCTIANNTAGDKSGIDATVAIAMVNTIVYGNTGHSTNENLLTGTTPTYSFYDYGATSGDTPGTGCIDGGAFNPLFEDPANGNFLLRPNSPCISTALDLGDGSQYLDINGNNPDSTGPAGWDMGAIQFFGIFNKGFGVKPFGCEPFGASPFGTNPYKQN